MASASHGADDARPRILIAHVNHAVGVAVVQRLMDAAFVSVADVPGAAAALRGPAAYDAVVLCPYLEEEEVRELLALCARREPTPAVMRLTDEQDEPRRTEWLAAPRSPSSPLASLLGAMALLL